MSKNNKEVKILHQNIRSVRANFDCFLVQLEAEKIIPDIIVLTEIWIKESESHFYEIPNYNSFIKTNENYRAGGVKVFVKTNVKVLSNVSIVCQSADFLKIEFKFNNQIFCLLALYRFHFMPREIFLEDLSKVLDNSKKNNIIYIGDININLLSSDSVVDNYNILMASNGLECLSLEPTRITNETSSCIDHCFARIINRAEAEVNVKVLQTNITDHATTLACVCVRKGEEPVDLETVSYRIDYEALVVRLNEIDWTGIYNEPDPSIAFDNFEGIFQSAINKCKVLNNANSKVKKIKPWMNDFICMKIRVKNKIYKKLQSHPTNTKLKKYFLKYRNDLQVKIRQLKNSYYDKCFQKCNGDSKQLWKVIREVTCQKSNNTSQIYLNIQGKMVNDPKILSNEFNNFFLSVVSSLDIKTFNPDVFNAIDVSNCFAVPVSVCSMFIDPVLPVDLENVIRSLKNSKSPGFDSITSALIKKVYPSIANVLLYLINLSFQKGIFPDKLKVAVVVPLHKGGSANDCNQFRPISLLSTFAKIYEKLMKKKLINFLERTNFISKFQFGFREGLNTEHALKNFMDSVFDGLNHSKKVSGLFLDIKKAFDTVDHKILLEKIYNCGIRGNVYNWFESYLTGRNQCVKLNMTFSNFGVIQQGVPQGSVLGAILFLIYVNDLCNAKFKGCVTAFADDTAFSYIADSWEEIEQHINEDLKALQWWFSKNHMLLSPEKTKYINFSQRKEIHFANEIIYRCMQCLSKNSHCADCAVVGQTDNIKYLGVILDQDIKWEKHIQKLKLKLNSALRYFYFLSPMCNEKILRMLYFSLVHSRIEYGLFCWGGTFETNIKPIFIQQKKFLRIIFKKCRMEPSYPLFVQAKILPLKYMFVFKVLKIFYVISGNFPHHVNYVKNKLRKIEILSVPRPYFSFYTKCYQFLGPRIYNLIPQNIRLCCNKKLFLKMLRDWLLSFENIDFLLNVQT